MQPKKTQRQTHGPTGLCELFLLTVPIEEVARWQCRPTSSVDALTFKLPVLY